MQRIIQDGRPMLVVDPQDPEDIARIGRDLNGIHDDSIGTALRDIERELSPERPARKRKVQ